MTEILIHVPSDNVLDNIIPFLHDLNINFSASSTKFSNPSENNESSKHIQSLCSEFCISNFSNQIKYFEEGD